MENYLNYHIFLNNFNIYATLFSRIKSIAILLIQSNKKLSFELLYLNKMGQAPWWDINRTPSPWMGIEIHKLNRTGITSKMKFFKHYTKITIGRDLLKEYSQFHSAIKISDNFSNQQSCKDSWSRKEWRDKQYNWKRRRRAMNT